MKFKRLTLEELKELEPEFITFLASNQISAEDWIVIKSKKTDKMNELLDFFSDLVYEKVLKKIMYLEHRTPKEIRLFHLGEDKITLIGIKVEAHNNIDFTLDNILEQLSHASNFKTSIFESKKDYLKDRSSEIFDLLESGCLIATENLFNTLMLARK